MSILLSLLLLISITINGLLIWYSKILIQKQYLIYKNIDEFQNYLLDFNQNCQQVFELTDYYGDQTIKTLIDDTKSVTEACQNFKVSVLDQETEQKNDTKTE